MPTRALLVALLTLLGGVTGFADGPTSAPPGAPPAATPGAAVTVPTFGNTTCPIMGRPGSKTMFADTEWGRIYVCCPPCIRKILADPERAYKAAYPVTKKVGNTVDPVTGKPLPLDAPAATVVLQGNEIRVCPTCAKQAQANAQIVLTKVLMPKVVDVGNRTDPLTGQPVVDNAFVLIGNDLVHLSSPKSVDEVKKDPATALRKAKDIAARQAAAPAAPAPGSPAPSK